MVSVIMILRKGRSIFSLRDRYTHGMKKRKTPVDGGGCWRSILILSVNTHWQRKLAS